MGEEHSDSGTLQWGAREWKHQIKAPSTFTP